MTRSRERAGADAAPETAPRPLSRRAGRTHLLGAALTIALLAWHREATVASAPGGRLEDPDAMFHARRVVREIVSRRWLPPVFDTFENFPDGGRAVWPPLHDAALALLARLGGSTAARPESGMLAAAAFPVLELVAVVLAVAALARRTGGERGAAAAAWLAGVR